MSVNDEQQFPWLTDEKRFIRRAIDTGKTVLGICLGSQLVSAALGAEVYQNKEKEIGWFDIELTCFGISDPLFSELGNRLKVFHWHGDTFDLPPHAVHLARSEGCGNQAFCIGERVLGLQFHLEATPFTVTSLIEQCRHDLVPGRYIQSEAEMLSVPSRFQRINGVMDALLDHWNNLKS